jgi:hypothetical protein
MIKNETKKNQISNKSDLINHQTNYSVPKKKKNTQQIFPKIKTKFSKLK